MIDQCTDAPLGARIVGDGVEFAVWAPEATSVELVLVGSTAPRNLPMVRDASGRWILTVPGIGAGQLYAYRADGPWDPSQGLVFNPHKVLLDPYARALSGGVDFRGDIRAFRSDAPHLRDENDSMGAVPLGVVVADTPPPKPIARRRPMSQSVIYETHLRGMTKLHPLVPDHLRGSFLGLAYPDVIEYLKDLGITAIELLPIQHFVSEPFVATKGLRNYWGYNTLGFFAPESMYKAHGTPGDQIAHFKQMVSALHEARIEVILDVVYNHTAEGGLDGPTLSWRGLAQRQYYRMDQHFSYDYDVTGCGNSLNTAHPMVRRLIIDSLRYWVTKMGVDGFRFDLATTLFRDGQHHVVNDHPLRQMIMEDRTFTGIKMIAEPWDIGPFGYQLGHYLAGWSEWNDQFRDQVRDFWRGRSAGVSDLATRLAGSPDVFDRPDRAPTASINFVTAHDGFTMRDLVSYDVKHNQANGESNRDGAEDNRSWNHGIEGETDDPQIQALRRRQVLNLMATQLLAVGTPMLLGGDEFGRTQYGNNNAYCQDTPLSWFSWEVAPEWDTVRKKIRQLIHLRREQPLLHRSTYRYHREILDGAHRSLERIDLTWINDDGTLMSPSEWNDPNRRCLGMYLSDQTDAFLIWFNADEHPAPRVLPGVQMGKDYQVAWASCPDEELPKTPCQAGETIEVPARCVLVLHPRVALSAEELEHWRSANASPPARLLV